MQTSSLMTTYLKLLFSAFFWGGTFVAARVLAQNIGPFSAAFIRFSIASVLLVLITIRVEKRFPLPTRKNILPVLILGLTGIFLYNFCFFSGLKYIEASRASVIVANNPILIAFFSALLFNEKLNLSKIAGIILSVTGAMVVITKGELFSVFHESIGKGELYIFGTVASWVAYSLFGKAFLKNFTPLQTVTYSVLTGTALLFLPAVNEGVLTTMIHYRPLDWLSLFYLGAFGTVIAFIFYYQGIKAIGPTRAGLFINFVPISGVLLSAALLSEPLTFSLLAGLALVITGMFLTNSKAFERAPEPGGTG
ncbi:MAG: DMT family transporter [Desulfobacteraceae bacterium]